MRKLLFFLMFYPLLTQAATSIPYTAMHTAQAVANNIIIERAYTTIPDGSIQDSLIAKWSVSYNGTLTHYCSITLVSEFLALMEGNPMMLSLALIAPTPHGWMASWDSTVQPPNGINPWCTQ